MQLYLDSADIKDWAGLMPTGLFRGITTNPALAARAGLYYPQIDWAEMAQRAADLGARELHAQVYGAPETYAPWADRLMQASERAGIRTVVKVPLVAASIRTVPGLRRAGCPVLMTACYAPKQMLVASALGAEFIAPYFGRMLEAGLNADLQAGKISQKPRQNPRGRASGVLIQRKHHKMVGARAMRLIIEHNAPWPRIMYQPKFPKAPGFGQSFRCCAAPCPAQRRVFSSTRVPHRTATRYCPRRQPWQA